MINEEFSDGESLTDFYMKRVSKKNDDYNNLSSNHCG